MKRLMTLLCLIPVIAAEARLGETQRQCTERFGSEPKALYTDWYAYTMGPYYIELHIGPANTADTILIQRLFNGKPIDMQASEVRTILEANTSNQSVWYEIDKSFGTQDWRMMRDQTGNPPTGNSQARIYLWKSRDQKHASYDAQAKVLLISSLPDHPFPPEANKF